MGKLADKRDAEIFRRRVREMLAAGATVAQIMKANGTSYVHTARIAEQVRAELAKEPQ